MLIAKFFDYEGAFVEAVNVSKMSWTRQKNKEYTFNVELASIPNASDYRILLLDTENLLRVLPSGYVTDYDGEYTLSISSWEQHLGNASKIPENWQWWDRKSLALAIADHCYGFGKVSYAGLASLQSAFSATHVVISELDDSNGDIYLDTFQYLSPSEIAYYELGSVVYRITVPSEARRPGMVLRWVDSVGSTTDISVQFGWSDNSTGAGMTYSVEQSPTRSDSITPNQTRGVDIPEGSNTYLFVKFNLKYDAGTDGINYEQEITTVQGSTGNIVYYGKTPILNAFEVIYRTNTLVVPGTITVPATLITADIHDKEDNLASLKAIAEAYDIVFFCSVDSSGSVLLNAYSSYVTDMSNEIGCISDAVNASVSSVKKNIDLFDACHCYGAGDGIDRLYAFVKLSGVTTPHNITTFDDSDINTVTELETAGAAYLESENEADTTVEFEWYGSPVLQALDSIPVAIGAAVYKDTITEESFTYDSNGLSKRSYVLGIKTYPLKSLIGSAYSGKYLPTIPTPTNVKASRGNDGITVSWLGTSESYIVEYQRTGSFYWSRISTQNNSISLNVLQNNTEYTFRVYAVDGAYLSEPGVTILNSSISPVEAIETGTDTNVPNDVAGISGQAFEDMIKMSITWNGLGLANNVQYFLVQLSKNGGAFSASIESTSTEPYYEFSRDVDGYPSIAELETWKIRVKAVNTSNNMSTAWYPSETGASIDISGYKGWTPALPSVSTRVNGRGLTIGWSTSSDWFGESDTDIQIAKGYTVLPTGEIALITDLETLVAYAPALGLDPTASYDNYREGAINGYLSRAGSSVSLSLPLYGQNENPVTTRSTPYYIRTRSSSKVPTTAIPDARLVSDWTSWELVFAAATTAQDVVRAWTLSDTGEKVKVDGALGVYQIFAEMLSAITANLGVITDGAMVGNENNMWALSRIYDTDGITVLYYEGTMKVGGTDQYLHVTPVVVGGVVTNYNIDFRVGNFTVTAVGSTINGVFEVRNVADNVVYFSVDPSKYGVAKIRNALEIGSPATSADRLTIKEGYSITDLAFTGTGRNDMEIAEDGNVTADMEVEVIGGSTEFTTANSGSLNWRSICSDPSGNIWAAVEGGDIYRCPSGSTTFTAVEAGSKIWLSICSDPSGNIWACAFSDDIYYCPSGSTTFVPSNAGSLNWRSICSDPSGNIWAAVYNTGDIYRCSSGSTAFVPVGGISRNWFSICSDPSGNIWAAVEGGDIYRCPSGSTTFTAVEAGSKIWRSICSDPSGNIWSCAFSDDIYYCPSGSTTFTAVEAGSKIWWSICSDPSGNIWAAVEGGDIYRCPSGSTAFVPVGGISRSWFSICSDPSGNIWAAADNNYIYKSDPGFRWREALGTWSDVLVISLNTQYTLTGYGTKIQFAHADGHVVGDLWTFHQGLVGSISARDVDGVEYFSVRNGIVSGRFIPPIGTIYVQFPGKTDPGTLFGGVWDNISSEFAGDFFRAEGGNASVFGSGRQAGLVMEHVHGTTVGGMSAHATHSHTDRALSSHNGLYTGYSVVAGTAANSKSVSTADLSHNHTVTILKNVGAENRSQNRTIRIFERKA